MTNLERKIIIVLVITQTFYSGLRAQDSLGWKEYERIEINPKSVVFPKQYVPFDAPFYIVGANEGIEAIHLRIIDDSYVPHSDQYDLYEKKSDEEDCNCDCKSVTDKRIEFFRMVRRIERGDLEKIENELSLLKSAEKHLDNILAFLDPVKGELKDDEITGLKSDIDKLKGVYEIKLDPVFNTIRPDDEEQKLIEQLDEIPSLVNLIFEKGSADVTLANFGPVLKLRGSGILLENLIDQSRADLRNLKRFIEKQVGEVLFRKYYEQRNDKVALEKFKKDHEKLRTWEGHRANYAEMIKTDSLSYYDMKQPFDPRKCNVICSWNRNRIIGDAENFYLPVPALKPNRNYKFYFEITRTVNDSERKDLQFFVTRSVVAKMDSIVDTTIETFADINYSNLSTIRENFFNQNYRVLDTRIVKEIISGRLRSYFGQQLKTETILIDRIDDDFSRKRLVDEIIQNKFYRMQMESSYKQDSASEVRLRNLWIGALPDLNRFFAANQMQGYNLLSPLIRVVRRDSASTYINYHTVYEDIRKHVPTGLVSYDNLQQVSLRNLEKVNDFDSKTVDPYLTNLDSYATYLASVQKYLEDNLIRKGDQRGTLFGATGVRRTPREAENADASLKGRFTSIYLNLDEHRTDVLRFRNVYNSYQKNIVDINKQAKYLIDSLLNNNRLIQIAAARTTGGISSADFITRSEWYVTADIGIALLPISNRVGASVAPYFGVNFNTHPLNRQVHYGLFGSSRDRRYLDYKNVSKKFYRYDHPFWNTLWKGSSFVLGLTLTDLGVAGVRENLINTGGKYNLLTGFGIRLTDAARLSTGTVWTKALNPNPLIDESRVVANWYVSLSFDFDVYKSLGKVGELLHPEK